MELLEHNLCSLVDLKSRLSFCCSFAMPIAKTATAIGTVYSYLQGTYQVARTTGVTVNTS